MIRRIEVELGERAYSIHIGQNILANCCLMEPLIRKRAAIVTNTVVAPLYLDTLVNALSAAGIDCFSIVLPDGEAQKNWNSLSAVFDALVQNKAERSTTLIALGGGVIGDTTGFAAACYQRGVPFVQVPTTLLSQVDSSVGGKTAINHPGGKNMIGAFYQPKGVLIDTATLSTLPDREFNSGLAEVIKYGLIRDRPFFEWLEDNIGEIISRNSHVLTEAIARSCQNKADLVKSDETEHGERVLLNLGHTFGHAIEAGLGYGVWLHGEAVAVGTMMAAELSRIKGWLKAEDVDRIRGLLERAHLPVQGPRGMTPSQYSSLMSIDKKVKDGQQRFVLLRSIGKAEATSDVEQSEVFAAISEWTETSQIQ